MARQPVTGRDDRAAGHAARSRRLLRSRRTVSAALVAADDRDPGTRGRRAGGHRRLPAARRDGDVRGARSGRRRGCSASAARTPIAALAYGTATVPRVDRIVGPGNAYVAAAKALVSRDCAIDFFAGPSEIVVVSSRGRPAWIAADLIAQAEHDPDARAILLTPNRRLAAAVAARSRAGRCRPTDRPRRRLAPTAESSSRGRSTRRSSCASGWRLSTWCATRDALAATADPGRHGVRRRLQRAGRRRLRHRLEPRAADERRGGRRGGLSAADFVRVSTVQRLTAAGLRRIAPGSRRPRGGRRARRRTRSRSASDLLHAREARHDEPRVRERHHAGIRTAAAPEREHRRLLPGRPRRAARSSPATMRRSIRTTTAAVALRAPPGCAGGPLLLTNGLDEGILAASVAALRGSAADAPFEAIVVVPAFDMYAACADAVGGRVVEVPLGTVSRFRSTGVIARSASERGSSS